MLHQNNHFVMAQHGFFDNTQDYAEIASRIVVPGYSPRMSREEFSEWFRESDLMFIHPNMAVSLDVYNRYWQNWQHHNDPDDEGQRIRAVNNWIRLRNKFQSKVSHNVRLRDKERKKQVLERYYDPANESGYVKHRFRDNPNRRDYYDPVTEPYNPNPWLGQSALNDFDPNEYFGPEWDDIVPLKKYKVD